MSDPGRLEAFLAAPPGAVCLRMYRFTKASAEAAPGAADLLLDLVGGGGEVYPREGHDRPGLRLVWLDAAGRFLGQMSLWPLPPAQEDAILPGCFRAAARAKAWLEVHRDGGRFQGGQLVERWYAADALAEPAPVDGGGQALLAAPAEEAARVLAAAGWHVERSGAAVRLSRTTVRRRHRALLLLLAPVALLAPVLLLFRAGRELLSSAFHAVLHGALTSGESRVEFEVSPTTLRALETGEDGQAHALEVPAAAIVALSASPLRVITGEAALQLPVPAAHGSTHGGAFKAVLGAALAAGRGGSRAPTA
jgi:hypothetical protein